MDRTEFEGRQLRAPSLVAVECDQGKSKRARSQNGNLTNDEGRKQDEEDNNR